MSTAWQIEDNYVPAHTHGQDREGREIRLAARVKAHYVAGCGVEIAIEDEEGNLIIACLDEGQGVYDDDGGAFRELVENVLGA